MALYLMQLSYTKESLAAQMKNPQDRLKTNSEMMAKSTGSKVLAAGYAFGEFDVALVVETADNTTIAAISIALSAGGAVASVKTTPLLSGNEWVAAMTKASTVTYSPAVPKK